VFVVENNASDIGNSPLYGKRSSKFDQLSLRCNDVVLVTQGDLGCDSVLVQLKALLQGIALVELNVEILSDEMIGKFGVKGARQKVVVALRVERNKHGL
jgi:hypothetical protein